MIARADCSGDGEVTEEDQGSAALSISIIFAVNNIPVRLHASAFRFFCPPSPAGLLRSHDAEDIPLLTLPGCQAVWAGPMRACSPLAGDFELDQFRFRMKDR